MLDPVAKHRREAQIRRAELIVLHNKNMIRLVTRKQRLFQLFSKQAAHRERQRHMVQFLADRVYQEKMAEEFYRNYFRMPRDNRPDLPVKDEFADV